MVTEVKNTLKGENMLTDSDVTVALSGGADSVSLLLVLYELRDELGIKLSAAHLNHSLRGEESDRDEQFCKELCEKLNIPFASRKVDVKSEAEKSGESIELAARRIRYSFLYEVSGGLIATAHTADDNLETVIFNLARGTGLSGISGIPPKRDRIIRPLIDIERVEVERYLKEKGQDYRTDSSNLHDDYSRNFIRHNIIPEIKKLNTSAASTVRGTSKGVRADLEYLNGIADAEAKKLVTARGLSLAGLKRLNSAISSRIVISEYQRVSGVTPSRKTVEKILSIIENEYGKAVGEGSWNIEARQGELCFYRQSSKIDDTVLCLEKGKMTVGDAIIVKMSINEFKDSDFVHKKLLYAAVDCDKIVGTVKIRARVEGDSIRPCGRRCTKTLKKLFNEMKVPSWERESVPLLLDEGGIIAVGYYAADERLKIDKDTVSVLAVIKEGGYFGKN